MAIVPCLGIEVANEVITVKEDDTFTLECKSDYKYQSCAFMIKDRKCGYELNIEKYHRDEPFPLDESNCDPHLKNRVAFVGNYYDNVCKIKIESASIKDLGRWRCMFK